MISIAIKYIYPQKTKEASDEIREISGIILAGDYAQPHPTSTNLIVEGKPFIQIGEFPIVFTPNAFIDTAVISDFRFRLEEFLFKIFKNPSNFSVLKFKEEYHKLHIQFTNMAKYYYEDTSEVMFDFIFAGSDKDGKSMLYYGEVGSRISMEDIGDHIGYIATKLGQYEGMTFLSAILKNKKIYFPIAEAAAITVMNMLCKIKADVSNNFGIMRLENGEVLELKPEALIEKRNLNDYMWNALWTSLKNCIKYPFYADYFQKKQKEGR